MQEGIKLVPLAIATAGMSLIPLYFGMRKRSVPTTIVSSLIVVTIAMNGNPEFSTATFLPLQLALAAIGVVIAYYGIKKYREGRYSSMIRIRKRSWCYTNSFFVYVCFVTTL